MMDDRLHQIEALAETAVMATLPLLPLSGSWLTGYRASDRISTTLAATPEEWAEAAHAISELHAVLAGVSASPQPDQGSAKASVSEHDASTEGGPR